MSLGSYKTNKVYQTAGGLNGIDTSYKTNLLSSPSIPNWGTNVSMGFKPVDNKPITSNVVNLPSNVGASNAIVSKPVSSNAGIGLPEEAPAVTDDAENTKTPTTYGQQLATLVGGASSSSYTNDSASSDNPPSNGTSGEAVNSSENGYRVDTYEEFLLKQEGFYKEQLDKLNAQIEQNKQNALQQAELQRQETEAQAERERERGVIDARSSYAQNLATYGVNAETLASMGLSGSGYSDYLTQQAYATQRAETQNANAQAEATKLNAKYTADAATLAAEQQANSDKLNAELSYAENLQSNAEKLAQYQQQKAEEAKAEEEQKKQYYAALLTSANTGEFTSEQIASLGAQYGLDEVQISQLQAAADKYEVNSKSEFYRTETNNIITQGSYYDLSYLDRALENGDIDQSSYDGLVQQYAKVCVEEGEYKIVDNLHKNGKIDDATYQSYIDDWNDDIDTSTAFFSGLDFTAGEQKFNNLCEQPWVSEEVIGALTKSFNTVYAKELEKNKPPISEPVVVDNGAHGGGGFRGR